ncbi:MAG: division/cell wall cluster transcriptional repressor MraZ [Rhizomicrobium sp.]|jgi:MraZ protein
MGAVVPPFISTMTGTLDGKGRVCIPSAFRQVLLAQGTVGAYVCPSFYEPALECFGEEVLQAFHQQQASQDPFFAAEGDDKTFAILSMTQLLAHDENGRVRLPDEFIVHAGLKDKVTFVGMGRKFQIWETDRFAPIQSERLARARAVRDGHRSNGGDL